jgi:hypothetical protein
VVIVDVQRNEAAQRFEYKVKQDDKLYNDGEWVEQGKLSEF